MSAHWIPNLRRDLPISVTLMVIAIAAVAPGVIPVILALAGITGLMLLRLSRGQVRIPTHSAPRERNGSAVPEHNDNRRGSHAAFRA